MDSIYFIIGFVFRYVNDASSSERQNSCGTLWYALYLIDLFCCTWKVSIVTFVDFVFWCKETCKYEILHSYETVVCWVLVQLEFCNGIQNRGFLMCAGISFVAIISIKASRKVLIKTLIKITLNKIYFLLTKQSDNSKSSQACGYGNQRQTYVVFPIFVRIIIILLKILIQTRSSDIWNRFDRLRRKMLFPCFMGKAFFFEIYQTCFICHSVFANVRPAFEVCWKSASKIALVICPETHERNTYISLSVSIDIISFICPPAIS